MMKKILFGLIALLGISIQEPRAQGTPIQIQNLPPASVPLGSSDLLIVSQGNVARKVTIANFPTAFGFLSSALTNSFIFVGNSSNLATGVAMSGDCIISNIGAIVCTKTNGTPFGTAATVNTGTSGATIPLNNGGFTQSGTVNFTSTFQIGGFTMTFPGSAATLAALNVVDQTLSGGANVTSHSIGTVSSGTTTMDCGQNPLQYLTNNGAFTLAAPAADGSCILLITNAASAGTITFSGFSVGSNTGDTLTTTNTSKFSLSIWRINGTSGYRVAAMQ